MTYQLNQHLVRKLSQPRYIYNLLSGSKREKAFAVAMRVLAHFKRHQRLSWPEIERLAAGAYLRRSALKEVMKVLHERRLIVGGNGRKGWKARTSIYKRVSF
jgi:hypothetical protein